jgi:hypothetical protein
MSLIVNLESTLKVMIKMLKKKLKVFQEATNQLLLQLVLLKLTSINSLPKVLLVQTTKLMN